MKFMYINVEKYMFQNEFIKATFCGNIKKKICEQKKN